MPMNHTLSNDIDSIDFPLEVQIALTVTLALIIILAIFGNTLVVLTILHTSSLRKQTSSLFLLNLALTDIACAGLVMPFALVSVWQTSWIFGDFWCDGVCFFNYCFIIVSMATLALISLDRYLFVVYPLRYEQLVTKRKAITSCCLGWFVGFVFGVAPAIAGWVWYDRNEIICAINWENGKPAVIYTVTAFVICFMFPMMVMFFAYHCIYKVARSHAKRIARTQPRSRHNSNASGGRRSVSGEERPFSSYNAKAIKTILIMIVAYAVCNTPFSLTKLIKVVYSDNYSVPPALSTLASWLGYVNPCCNPIIYAINREEFRNAFRRMLTLSRFRHKIVMGGSSERAVASMSHASVFSISKKQTILELTPIPKVSQDDESEPHEENDWTVGEPSGRRESGLVSPLSMSHLTIGLPGSTSDELYVEKGYETSRTYSF